MVRFRPGAEPRPGLAQLGPGEHQHVDRQVPGPVDQMVQEIQQPRVGVLGILDQQHHRVLRREPLEEQPPPGEQLLPRQRRPAVPGERDAEQPAQPQPRHTPARPGRGRTGPALPPACPPRSRRGLPRRCRAAGGRSRPAPRTPPPPRRTGTGPGATTPPPPAHRCTSRTPSPAGTCPPRPARTPAPAAAPAGPPPHGTAP